jgi:hypothetical protein
VTHSLSSLGNSLSPVAYASKRLADVVGMVPGNDRVVTTVAAIVAPPAIVIGPPRLRWSDYGSSFSGVPTTAQWNIYLVVAQNQYAIDNLLAQVASITNMIERQTEGVVIGAGPGLYPSPSGALPAYIIVVQMEVVMA